MNIRKKHKLRKKLFALFGIFIPLYTFTFSYKGPYGDLILVTFSQIGARYGAIEQLIIWGIMSSLYYFLFLSYLFNMAGQNNKVIKFLLSITCITLLITVFLPYAPTMFPFAAKTHNYLAYITVSCIVFTILLFVISLSKLDQKLFFKSFSSFIIVFAILLYTLLTYGVSSLFQIVLSTVLCSFIFIIMVFLEKCDKIDIYSNLEKIEKNSNESSSIF